ncbi:MAG: response regulator [Pseudomonas sp.]
MNNNRPTNKSVRILVADDDHDDCLLTREAFEDSQVAPTLDFVHDGEQLMNYLLHRPPYEDAKKYPLPGLILLDLNMPRMDGREALTEIKQHPLLRRIPVIVLTTSSSEQDIAQSYQCGVNSFITKPVTYSGLVDMVNLLSRYWLDMVKLPKLTPLSEV